MTIAVRCYANGDDALVAWQMPAPIPGLRGFALRRRRNGAEEWVDTWVGPADPAAPPEPPGTNKPSTEWPIQKFQWTDYLTQPGDRVAYRVIPVTAAGPGPAQPLTVRYELASRWTATVRIAPAVSRSVSVFTNRGIVASQWLSRRLGDESTSLTDLGTALDVVIVSIGDPVRDFLAGDVRSALLGLLGDAHARGQHLYGALFELSDPELLDALRPFGGRAHLVLANGAYQHPGEDENADARKALLDAGVEVHDRMLRGGRLGHHKFVVVADSPGAPRSVWTGSTNWTPTGLCTQANNALLVRDRAVAAGFLAEWTRLRDARDATPPALVAEHGTATRATVDRRPTAAWFTPTPQRQELDEGRAAIDAARQGILFLMFMPGPTGSLLNAILERMREGSPTFDPALHVHGVVNSDPSTKKNPVDLFHRGSQQRASYDIVLPAAVDERLKFWLPELKKKFGAHAMVHSKLVVVDPFSDQPVVITGSHNLGPKGSGRNDENLVILRDHAPLARAYAVTIMSIYNQYRWRFWLSQHAGAPQFVGTDTDDRWQASYLDPAGAKAREIAFYFGQRMR
jgi:phosphatidylserine/phosphatidylglycerophosphate/cardiolipin synthase-like enzyme